MPEFEPFIPLTGTAQVPPTIRQEIERRFPGVLLAEQSTQDGIPTLWVPRTRVQEVLGFVKQEIPRPYRMLFDLTAIDERTRVHREGQPEGTFTVVYHLMSFERNADLRIKVPLEGEYPALPSLTPLWANANWYERETWDMFGITFEGHPHLARLLMPRTWTGHPLRKEHPARATEMGPFQLPDEKQQEEQEALKFHPEEWGLRRQAEDTEFLFLNLGLSIPVLMGFFGLCFSWTERSLSTPFRRSAFTTAVPKRWASASRGIPIFPTRIGLTTWAGS